MEAIKKYTFIIQMCLEKGRKFWESRGKIREFCREQNVETMPILTLDGGTPYPVLTLDVVPPVIEGWGYPSVSQMGIPPSPEMWTDEHLRK